MKIKGVWLVIALFVVMISTWLFSESVTPKVNSKIVNDTCFYVTVKAKKGKMLSEEFQDYFKNFKNFQDQNNDSLTEIIFYNVEPTIQNERYTEIEGGFVGDLKDFRGAEFKKVCLENYLMLTQSNNAGLYNTIEREAEKKGVVLDKNFAVEIENSDEISLLIKVIDEL